MLRLDNRGAPTLGEQRCAIFNEKLSRGFLLFEICELPQKLTGSESHSRACFRRDPFLHDIGSAFTLACLTRLQSDRVRQAGCTI